MTDTQSRRSVLTTAAAALAGGAALNIGAIAATKAAETGSSPVPVSDDPIFAAIERHREECEGINIAAAVYHARDYHLADACDEERDLYEALRQQGAPTTLAGWAALLRYVTAYESDIGDVTEQLQEFCGRLADALDRTAVAS
jgi:hypothetical protein